MFRKVKILKCSNPTLWYTHRVGHVELIREETEDAYISAVNIMINGKWNNYPKILKTDAELQDE
jgi:hypothetical protein